MAEELGLSIDEAGLAQAEKDAKEASKGLGKKGGAETVKLDVHDLGKLDAEGTIPKTEDSAKFGAHAPLARLKGDLG
jgi:alanyl-tRNA synthetase